MPTSQARRLALQGAYCLGESLVGDLGGGIDSAFALEKNNEFKNPSKRLLANLVEAYNKKREEAIAIVDAHMDFPLEEVPLVEKIVLVLATLEMMCCQDTPKAIVINEWVELCKEFGSSGSHKMINAVLDKIEIPKD